MRQQQSSSSAEEMAVSASSAASLNHARYLLCGGEQEARPN